MRVFKNAKDFARAVAMSEITYRAHESGQNGYAKYAAEYARSLNVSTDWLLLGGPLPETEAPEPPQPGELGTPENLEDMGIELIREVDISYAMGDGAIVDDYPETGFLPFDRNQLKKFTSASPRQLFIATGHGDSMFPTLHPNDIILVDTSQDHVRQQDRLWALTYAGTGMIKRLRRLPGGRYLILSDNESVPPQEAEHDDVHIVGRVVWMARDMR